MMQAKDIPDTTFLEAVRVYNDGEAPTMAGPRWALVWDLESFGPDNLIRAKARKLIHRGLLSGCPCGCRGDFEITEAGRAFLRGE